MRRHYHTIYTPTKRDCAKCRNFENLCSQEFRGQTRRTILTGFEDDKFGDMIQELCALFELVGFHRNNMPRNEEKLIESWLCRITFLKTGPCKLMCQFV